MDWDMKNVLWKTVQELMDQKKLRVDFNDPCVLHKIRKINMAVMMRNVKEFLRLCCNVKRAPFTCIMRKLSKQLLMMK